VNKCAHVRQNLTKL